MLLFLFVRVLFYCYFSDMLLIIRKSFFKIFYRKFIDKFEEYIIGMVYKVLVNSYFIGKIMIVVIYIFIKIIFYCIFNFNY